MHLGSICNFDQIHFIEITLIILQCLQKNIYLRQVCMYSTSTEQAFVDKFCVQDGLFRQKGQHLSRETEMLCLAYKFGIIKAYESRKFAGGVGSYGHRTHTVKSGLE